MKLKFFRKKNVLKQDGPGSLNRLICELIQKKVYAQRKATSCMMSFGVIQILG